MSLPSKSHLRGYLFLCLTVVLWLGVTYSVQVVQQVKLISGAEDEEDYEKPFFLTYLVLFSYLVGGIAPAILEFRARTAAKGEVTQAEGRGSTSQSPGMDPLGADRPACLKLVTLGSLSIMYHYVWYMSLNYTSAAVNLTLCNSISVFTALFSWPLLKETLSRGQWAAGIVLLAGASWVTMTSEQEGVNTWYGCLLCLSEAVLQALYGVLFKKWVPKNYPIGVFLFLAGASAVLCFWPVIVFLDLTGLEKFALPPSSLSWLLLLVCLLSGLMFNWAFHRAVDLCSPTVVTVWLTMAVPLGAVIDYLAYGRGLSLHCFLGGSLVILAFLVFNLIRARRECLEKRHQSGSDDVKRQDPERLAEKSPSAGSTRPAVSEGECHAHEKV